VVQLKVRWSHGEMTMRTLLVLLTLLFAPAAQAAPVFEDPQELLEYAYQPYRDGGFLEDPFELYSTSLLERWAMMVAHTPDDEVGAVEFDPMINAQDYDLGTITIGAPRRHGERTTVTVGFQNFGRREEIRFTLVHGDTGWKIDDIESLAPGFEWRLSEILAPAPLPE
jgi:hypothetical protein